MHFLANKKFMVELFHNIVALVSLLPSTHKNHFG